MYKLRIYKKSGADKGNVDHEELFQTESEAINRYNELFVYNDFGLNPTLWKQKSDKSWTRVSGY